MRLLFTSEQLSRSVILPNRFLRENAHPTVTLSNSVWSDRHLCHLVNFSYDARAVSNAIYNSLRSSSDHRWQLCARRGVVSGRGVALWLHNRCQNCLILSCVHNIGEFGSRVFPGITCGTPWVCPSQRDVRLTERDNHSLVERSLTDSV